jgi:Fe-S cluster assembly scaffold protein SufB
VVVAPGARPEPVHLCFGMLPREGTLDVRASIRVGAGAEARFIACCTFPRATRIRHQMDSMIHIGEGAVVAFDEVHFHGPHGGIEVVPRTRVVVADDARFVSTFSLVHGRVGVLDIGYDVAVGAYGVADLTTKAFGRGDDRVRVDEVLHLNREHARGVLKSRIAVRDSATSDVTTTAEGNAAHCRGHMDCTEIVRGNATASNVPHVVVRHEQARITHEAAIGTVNRTELETLMARGLDEEDAVDVIVRGMLR